MIADRSGPLAVGYRRALALYVMLFAVLTWPYWGRGEVVAPHRQQAELGEQVTPGVLLENRGFNDYVRVFLPELSQQLHGPRSGWISLWSERNELGRPLYHVSGLSPAYVPTWVLSRFCRDSYLFITILTLGQTFLGGLFVLGLSREMGWTASTGLVAGGLFASSPFLLFWLTFPMFVATWTWSAGALWGLWRLARTSDRGGWCLLAFSVYSLAMAGYPQLVVWHGYLLAGCGAALFVRRWRESGGRAAGAWAVQVVGAVAVGTLTVVPVYRDLAVAWADSLRVRPEPSFFTVVLASLHSAADALRWFVRMTLPQLGGNPMAPGHPLNGDGLVITPLALLLAAAGLAAGFRRAWVWGGAVVVILAFTACPALFVWGVRYLGLSLSRTNPAACLLMPVTMLAALGAEALTAGRVSRRLAAGLGVVAVAIMAGWVLWGWQQPRPVHTGALVGAIIVWSAVTAAWIRPATRWWVAAVALNGAWFGYPLMLRQEPAQMVRTSPLVERLRARLAPHERYAMLAPAPSFLPPNTNALVGLNTVHSYDSLSSRRYHAAIATLGGRMLTLGRWNSTVAPEPGGLACWMSNIAVVVSGRRRPAPGFVRGEKVDGIWLADVANRMGFALQVTTAGTPASDGGVNIGDPRSLPVSRPELRRDDGDWLEFALASRQASILVLSQAYHRDWRAQVQIGSEWRAAPTLSINEVYQGVRLPAGTEMVRLRFLPWVRWAWLGHVFWLGMAAWLPFSGRFQRRNERSAHSI